MIFLFLRWDVPWRVIKIIWVVNGKNCGCSRTKSIQQDFAWGTGTSWFGGEFCHKTAASFGIRQESFPLCPKGLGEWRHSIYGSDGSSCHAEQSRRFEDARSMGQESSMRIYESLKLPNVTSCMCSFPETSPAVKYSTWKHTSIHN